MPKLSQKSKFPWKVHHIKTLFHIFTQVVRVKGHHGNEIEFLIKSLFSEIFEDENSFFLNRNALRRAKFVLDSGRPKPALLEIYQILCSSQSARGITKFGFTEDDNWHVEPNWVRKKQH